MDRTPEYMAWQNMIQRCTNRNLRQYRDYGGRGIGVCPAWTGRGGFRKFLKSVGNRPTAAHSLDRRDNARGYEPGNVRWASRVEQNRNTSKNVMVTVAGKTLSLAEWSERTGIGHSTLRARIALGWSEEDVVSQPPRSKRAHGAELTRPPR